MQQRPLQPTELFSGNSITISGYRKAAPLVSLPNTVKKQLESRGWTITSLSGLYNYYPFNYSRAAATNISTSEERNTIAGEIGGAIEENARFPFNTLLITDDLLLHVFHKLFDNGLKYYEEQIARPTLTTLSEKLYKQYLNLSQDTYLKDNNWIDLLEIYDFLAAYRAIPHIFLPTNQELIEASTTRSSAMDMDLKTDLTDENIQNIIQKRTQTIAKTLAPTYQTLIPQIVEKILKADKDGANDEFLAILARKDLQSGDITLQQDYTQFKPRSHYTDSSLLKTYFMAMKWLMREKFYFNSKSLTLAAMVMSSTIPENDVKSLNQLSEQIKNLIGGDDDLTLNEMRDYLKQYGRINLPSGIIGTARPWEQIIEQLAALHPQKIQSTHYQADCLECITEDIAKQTTDGFVFFGEKFTLDSYLFDLTTAGSAEKEFAEKPNIQTAFIVPTILENSPLADQFVKLRLTEKAPHSILEDEGHTQLSSWDTIKAFAKEKVAQLIGTGLARSNSEAITHNIYHQRLQMLGLLLQAPLENAPYFRLDPVYALKNLITYLGSYTELKHDTLLYVKQAYAEMGGGGDDLCSIYVANPPLPVPKGYVESEPDFLDTLIKLNAETLPYFSGTYEQEKFREFGNILTKLKDISIKQMHNEIIDDADFEWLRLLPS
ncbi:MAG: DUF3160 domain-containing protein [Candidatus Peribacteria bacterium]|jgi:hypothetical protein|nr:DUF3160 domain-containing protein [Candidatus Peribacteria bacterium]